MSVPHADARYLQNVAKAEKEIETLKSQPLEEPSSTNGRDGRPPRGNRERQPREERSNKKNTNGVSAPAEAATEDDTTADATKDFNALSTESEEAPAVEA